MPHLLFRGVDPERLGAVSRNLVAELAELCACGTDNFTLESLHTTAISVETGEPVASFPFVEVGWFERGGNVRRQFAEIVDRHVRQAGPYPELEIVFVSYREQAYYINGVACAGGESEREGPVSTTESERESPFPSDGGKREGRPVSTDESDRKNLVPSNEAERETPVPSDETDRLREENARLKRQLAQARQSAQAASSMSTRLRDALRE